MPEIDFRDPVAAARELSARISAQAAAAAKAAQAPASATTSAFDPHAVSAALAPLILRSPSPLHAVQAVHEFLTGGQKPQAQPPAAPAVQKKAEGGAVQSLPEDPAAAWRMLLMGNP